MLTGALYYQELMNTNNVNRFRQVVRMDKDTFNSLEANLIEIHLSFLFDRLLNRPPETTTKTSISTLQLMSVHLIVMPLS